ncbi:MAG: nucleoside triphosphate pyrophosphohydrolase [Chloroflexi bacterium]|nr:nucleoside triphosphate pyrophosphohydrolase [Chloroflexota bacterium]
MKQGITIVGLGPGNPNQLTLEAQQVLQKAIEVYLRTCHHPTVASLPPGPSLHSFDHLYEEKETFAEVYDEIARQIVELGRQPEGVVYAVPGHPLVGEASVQRILALARQQGIGVRVVEGLSFIEPVLTCLGLDALAGLQLVDATELAALHHPCLNPDLPALVGQLYDQPLASEVKLTLMNLYPDEHPVTVVRGAGMDQAQILTMPLYELDRQPNVDHLTSLYVPPLPQPSSLETFQDTIARLRAPGGCPWDREQTHRSLRPHLLEESYEALAALDADDTDALREELGDLLLQIVLQVQIAVEAGEFSLAQVIEEIDAKIKRRHPHVFGDVIVADVAEVLHNWEEIKRGEGKRSVLDGVSSALPALARAQAVQERAARVGFDWPDAAGVVAKIAEEAAELRQAQGGEEREEELGDLLFSVVNLARWLSVDAESALREACERFIRRFCGMEDLCRERGLDLSELSLANQDDLWEQVKARGPKS